LAPSPEDFEANRLHRFYRQDGVVDMNYSPSAREIFNPHSRSYIPLDVVQDHPSCLTIAISAR